MQAINGLIVTHENVINLPVRHFSVSSILEYMKNEYSFFDKYVMLNFDNTTGQSLLVGSSFHAALEHYYRTAKEEGKILSKVEVLSYAFSHLNNSIDQNEEKGQVEFVKEVLGEELAADFLSLYDYDEEGEVKRIETQLKRVEFAEMNALNLEDFEASKTRFIKWGKTQGRLQALEELEILLQNYFTAIPYQASRILSIESNQTSQIIDLDGNEMPMPLKGKMDLIIEDENGDIEIVDHKSASSFSEDGKAQYELQAGAYFFLAWSVVGRKPKRMVFDEVLKTAQSLGKGLLKGDLVGIAKNSAIFLESFPDPDKMKVDELKKELFEFGLIEATPVLNRVVIDYDENPQVVAAFLQIYKTVLNRLGIMSLFDIPLEFLPNPFAQFSGEESWEKYKETLDVQSWKESLTKKIEENSQEIEDFDL